MTIEMKNIKNRYRLVLAMLLLALIGTIAVGCSTDDNDSRNVRDRDRNRQSITDTQEHTLDIQSDNLTKEDLILSLEGIGAKGALLDKDLSIADMLMYAAQDEYLAHGEYAAIIEEFGNVRPYTNIVVSEETHLDYLQQTYEANNIEFPKDEYSKTIVVPATLLEAAKTGVQAEIDNIAMYELFLKQDLPDNIKEVFNALMTASQNHLSAFQKQVDKLS